MTIIATFITAILLIGFAVGWVKLFGIRLSSVKVMLLGILLTVSGGMFVVASYMVLQKSRFMDGFGITLLWFGLIVGVLGFIMNDSDPSEKSSV